jgi:hypothetical protein
MCKLGAAHASSAHTHAPRQHDACARVPLLWQHARSQAASARERRSAVPCAHRVCDTAAAHMAARSTHLPSHLALHQHLVRAVAADAGRVHAALRAAASRAAALASPLRLNSSGHAAQRCSSCPARACAPPCRRTGACSTAARCLLAVHMPRQKATMSRTAMPARACLCVPCKTPIHGGARAHALWHRAAGARAPAWQHVRHGQCMQAT